MSKARNYGLDKAKGKYVCFFDGDDFIKDNYLLNLYEIMKNNDLELLIANCYLYPSMEIKYHQYSINEVMSGINLLNTNGNIHTNNDLSGSWRMIYDKQFLKTNNLYYNEKISYGEDAEFNLKSFIFAQRAMAVNLAGYCNDNTRMDSAMHLKYKKKL